MRPRWSWPRNAEGATRLTDRIRAILLEHGRLRVPPEALDDDTDLYQAGMTSHAGVNVMLGLEEAFDLEFPDSMLTRATFASVNAIRAAIEQLQPHL
jgi:acyl carrier protein